MPRTNEKNNKNLNLNEELTFISQLLQEDFPQTEDIFPIDLEDGIDDKALDF